MVDWLCSQTERPEDVAVAIETPHGPIVEALMDRGIAVFAINPKQLDRFRDRFSPAGAKDDRRDALVLFSSLRTDRHCFRRVEALDPTVVELREWSRMAEELKQERVRLTNRVRQQLWRYYPSGPRCGRRSRGRLGFGPLGQGAHPSFACLVARRGRAADREESRKGAGSTPHPPNRRSRSISDPEAPGADRGARHGRRGARSYRPRR